MGQVPDGAMRATRQNWDEGGEPSRWAYLHAADLFPASVVGRGPATRPLPVDLRPEVGEFVIDERDPVRPRLGEWLTTSPLDGFLILHHGAIVFEAYPRMRPDDRHLIFSVTKAFVGTVLGLLEGRGRLDLDSPVERYLPELAGSAWAGTAVRDVADMASGMEGEESSAAAYSDPAHPHYQLEASLGWRSALAGMPESVWEGDTYRFLGTLRRVRPAGERWVYTSANTLLLAALIERLTGRKLAEVLAEEIWGPMGAEQDALLLENERGVPIAHGGMATTLRDLARFGLQFTPPGWPPGSRGVIPDRFRERLLRERRPGLLLARPAGQVRHGSYQWDEVSADGAIAKGGFGDQLLYVHTGKGVVIAYFGTNAALDAPPTPLPLRALVERYF